MRHESILRLIPLLLTAIAVGGGIMVSSCSQEKQQTISISADPETFPTMRTLDVRTVITDSGYNRLFITTPEWLMFEEAQEPRWTFPQGAFLIEYGRDHKEIRTFTADTAVYWSKLRLWRFDRNVRMKNVNGDRFMTQQLFWDQTRQLLYTDSFIHIEESQRVIEGYGFESNEKMTEYTIRKPSGIFPTSDFVGKDPSS